LPSIACQESALHGLAHWHYAYEERVEAAVSDFLRREDLPPVLRTYAEKAMFGDVQ
jgi:hypothetical protein